MCVFANDELIEKFHALINNWISIAIDVVHNFVDDPNVDEPLDVDMTPTTAARFWSTDNKDKLLYAIVKIFSSNMPLYVTYKHLFFNNKDCCDTDTIALLQLYCQMHQVSCRGARFPSSLPLASIGFSKENEMPIELLRNICTFIDSNGMAAMRLCFARATPSTLPIATAHVLFNIIFNVSSWARSTLRPHLTFWLAKK